MPLSSREGSVLTQGRETKLLTFDQSEKLFSEFIVLHLWELYSGQLESQGGFRTNRRIDTMLRKGRSGALIACGIFSKSARRVSTGRVVPPIDRGRPVPPSPPR